MRGAWTKVLGRGAGCLAAALLLAACARGVDMSLASLYQRPAEFDYLLHQDAWACLTQGTPGREAAASSCAPNSARALRDLLAQRSSARPLKDYLADNGANCRSADAMTTCSYVKTLEAPVTFGRLAFSGEERVELTVSFPATDRNLAPEQIRTALRRLT
jgi:hypothetical protein